MTPTEPTTRDDVRVHDLDHLATLKPGDRAVFRYRGHLDPEAAVAVRDRLTELLGPDHRCAVVDDAVDVHPAPSVVNHGGRLAVQWADDAPPVTLVTRELVEGWAEQVNELRAEVELMRGILGELVLYVDWRHCTSQLTTEQKEAWAQAVEAWQGDLHADTPRALATLQPADKWWLCPTCGHNIRSGANDGPHEHCMYAHDEAGPAAAQGDPS